MRTSNPSQDFQDFIEDEHLKEDQNSEPASTMTTEQIDAHLSKIKYNRMNWFEKLRSRFIDRTHELLTSIN